MICTPHDILFGQIKSRMRCIGHMEYRGDRKCVYKDLVGRTDGTRPLGRPTHRWNYNIKMNLQEWDEEAWTGLLWLWIGTDGKCMGMP